MTDGYMGHARLLSSAEDRSEEWLYLRRSTIGGSDAGIILGVNPWQTPRDLWFSKREPEDLSGKPEVALGIILEPYAKELRKHDRDLSLMHPGSVSERPGTWRHPEHVWMTANVDAVLETGFLEVGHGQEYKVTGKKWDSVPEYYYAQVQHYMVVTGIPLWEVINCVCPLDRETLMRIWWRFSDVLDEQDFFQWVASKCSLQSFMVDADPDFQARLVERELEYLPWLESEEPPENPVPEGEVTLMEVEAPDIFGLFWDLCELDKEKNSDTVKDVARRFEDTKKELALRFASLGPVKKIHIGPNSATWVDSKNGGYWRFNIRGWNE